MRAIQIEEFGGPEVLRLREDVPEPELGAGFERLAVTTAGVNYADTHQAENSYLAPARLPLVPGAEAVGTLPDGRRVVAPPGGGGGYAEVAAAAGGAAWEVPDGVSDAQALGLVLQGTTAWHLLKTSARLWAGETVVVHAAAGGVGTLAVQLAKHFGAGRVIGVASSEEKRALAERLGADATVAGGEGMRDALLEANHGEPVDVVLEMVGGDTFAASLEALAPFGRLVHFGQAGRGGVPEVSPGALMGSSRGVLGFWLVHLLRKPALMDEAMQGLFELAEAGALEVVLGGEYPLADARLAHEALRGRATTGKLVLQV